MKANKIFFDLFSTSGGEISHEDYRKWYDKNDMVYIVLRDKSIYTKVHRKEMFDKNMHCGCFLETRPSRTPKEVRKEALALVKEINAIYVEPNEFIRIEQENEKERVSKAFARAEQLIAQR